MYLKFTAQCILLVRSKDVHLVYKVKIWVVWRKINRTLCKISPPNQGSHCSVEWFWIFIAWLFWILNLTIARTSRDFILSLLLHLAFSSATASFLPSFDWSIVMHCGCGSVREREVARWQNFIPSFPWIAPGGGLGGAIQGKEGIQFCSAA